jgi:hypothetical protein
LLDLLAVTLSGEKFKPPGMPINWKAASTPADLSVSILIIITFEGAVFSAMMP